MIQHHMRIEAMALASPICKLPLPLRRSEALSWLRPGCNSAPRQAHDQSSSIHYAEDPGEGQRDVVCFSAACEIKADNHLLRDLRRPCPSGYEQRLVRVLSKSWGRVGQACAWSPPRMAWASARCTASHTGS